ncbi:uncharacterized protein F13E9.13, mitochondrial [Episyrphus balteatus]|uniref:uncharacterized protein F13E9.13, mitochondrial n=1 Tax=Episyrphus balteatus TaxID=286459 RepID=UPI002485B797|nr:uncharacterized protein F13E9.13, mitochondrial [Episyrphus balteatus]
MKKFLNVFQKSNCNVIGMVHLDALPGTPKYSGNFNEIVEKAKHEANIYSQHKLDSILIENMHDVPYVQENALGPETISCMSRIATEIRKIIPKSMPCGIQVLACGNKQALAIAKACDLQYIRAEGFVFGHVADEGYTDACAGDILRYRRLIDAESVLVFTDLKKKHSSHSITADTSLLETAKAAEFFLTDGIIVTGTSTGHAASPDDLNALYGKVEVPLLIGSGVTKDNLKDYYEKANAVIIGSHFKKDGHWANDLCEGNIQEFMENLKKLRTK